MSRLLARLKNVDGTGGRLEAIDPPPETAERVNAILDVLTCYLDPDQQFANMLYVIARRELASADNERLDLVIRGVIDAADRLRPWAPPAPPLAAEA